MPRRCATPAGARSRDSEIFSDQAFHGAASENRTRDLRITRFDLGLHRSVWRCVDVLAQCGRVRRRAVLCSWVAASVAATGMPPRVGL